MNAALLDVIAGAIRSVAKRTETTVINEETRLVEDLGLDSLDLVSVIMKLEDQFEVRIELDDIPNLLRVSDLAGHIAQLRGDHSAAA
ncbi:MAG: hypothetical protein NVSMB9_04350 [Isosphaeraceae bacterium]